MHCVTDVEDKDKTVYKGSQAWSPGLQTEKSMLTYTACQRGQEAKLNLCTPAKEVFYTSLISIFVYSKDVC